MILSPRRTEALADADFDPGIRAENDRVRALYAAGVVRQIWLRGNLAGACLIIEAPDADTARAPVDSLPRAVSGLLKFTIHSPAPLPRFRPSLGTPPHGLLLIGNDRPADRTVTGAAQDAASAWVMTVPQPDP